MNAQNNRRVIFFDIDGVLQPDNRRDRFNHDRKALQKELAEKYSDSGNVEILPIAGNYSDKVKDIHAYLDANRDLKYYVILDDLNMEKEFPGHFVWLHTSSDCIREKEMLQAKVILEYGPWWDLALQESGWAERYNYFNEDYFRNIHDGIKKVIFLDFDGVLNDDLGSMGDGIAVRSKCIDMLKRIVDKTGAAIIMSSSRRLAYARFVESGYTGGCSELALKDLLLFQELLDKKGLRVVGQTPMIGSGPYSRPAEIRAWLMQRPDIEAFVILDDDMFWQWAEMQNNVVTTTRKRDDSTYSEYVRGMNEDDMLKAIEILNEQPMPKLIWAKGR